MSAVASLRAGLLALVVGLLVALLGFELMPASFAGSATYAGDASSSTGGSIDGKGWVVAGLVLAALGGVPVGVLHGRGRIVIAAALLLTAGAVVLALGVLHLPRPALYGDGWKVPVRGRGILDLGTALVVLATIGVVGTCVPRAVGRSIGRFARELLAASGRLGRLSSSALVVGSTAIVSSLAVMPRFAHLDFFGPSGRPGGEVAGFYDVILPRIWFFVGVPLAAVGALATAAFVLGARPRWAGVVAWLLTTAGTVLLVIGLSQIPRALRVHDGWPKVDLFVPGRETLEFGVALLVVGVVAAAARAWRLRRGAAQ